MLEKFKEFLHDFVYGIEEIPPTTNKLICTVDIQKLKEQLGKPSPSLVQIEKDILNSIQLNSDKAEEITSLPFDNHEQLLRLTEKNQSIVFKYLLTKIEHAIKSNKDSINVFYFEPIKDMASISKRNYEHQLEIIMNHYVQHEDYETAVNCRDLIRQLKVNDAVDQQR